MQELLEREFLNVYFSGENNKDNTILLVDISPALFHFQSDFFLSKGLAMLCEIAFSRSMRKTGFRASDILAFRFAFVWLYPFGNRRSQTVALQNIVIFITHTSWRLRLGKTNFFDLYFDVDVPRRFVFIPSTASSILDYPRFGFQVLIWTLKSLRRILWLLKGFSFNSLARCPSLLPRATVGRIQLDLEAKGSTNLKP